MRSRRLQDESTERIKKIRAIFLETGNASDKKKFFFFFKDYHSTTLTYGAETWKWTKVDIRRMLANEVRFLRIIAGK